MTGSNFFRHPSTPVSEFKDITTAIAVKTSLKGVFLFFYSLSRLFQLAYSVKCWRTLHEGKAVQWPPRKGNVKKKHSYKRAIHGQIQAFLVFYQSYSHHLVRWYPLWNPLSRQLYFAYLAAFFTWVSCLTPKFEAHDRKMNLWFRKFQGWLLKKGQNAYIFRFCFRYTMAF